MSNSGAGGLAINSALSSPSDITLDLVNNKVYFVESGSSKARVIDATTGIISLLLEQKLLDTMEITFKQHLHN